MAKCESFLPVINDRARILILGSMPGVKSLEEAQYYAHPKNRFWKVLGALCNRPGAENMEYEKRLEVLLENGFALWDVIKCCDREGSLDSNIQNEVVNDISGLVSKYKNIRVIILNGSKAYSAFRRHFGELEKHLECRKMPSTSPANARFRTDDLIREWKKGIKTEEA